MLRPDKPVIPLRYFNSSPEVVRQVVSLGVTRERLQEAVNAVGNSAEKVREYLRGK